MTKADLKIILLKIQNRCGLEEPTKITYYWNDKQQVVFKAFFESLYLPEALRVDEDNIQNSFTVQNVYEFEDEFEIIGLNQDEGYVEFIPDNQKFKIVNSYNIMISLLQQNVNCITSHKFTVYFKYFSY